MPDQSHDVTLGEAYRLIQRIDRRMDDLVTRGEHQSAMRRADEKHDAVVSEVKDLESNLGKVQEAVKKAAENQKNRVWTFAGTALMAAVALVVGLIGLLGPGGV